VSVLPQAYFVEQIGGDRVTVQVLIPPGASPATHEPTIAQLEELSSADVYVKVGCPNFAFEQTWFSKIEEANPHMRIVDSSRGVELVGSNPHIWLSVRAVKVQARGICAGLIEADPDHRAAYEANRDAFIEQLDSLAAEIKAAFASAKGRSFMVFHPAWAYFARDYGLDEIAIESEGKEPGPAELEQVIEIAKRKGIKVVYVQPQFDAKNARIVAEAIGGHVEELDPLARDWAANLRRAARMIAEGMK
jgi:zinc transport system substrate-binding protein